MKLPRIQFTIRRLMVGVALLALLMGVVVATASLADRWATYRWHAREYVQREQQFLAMAQFAEDASADFRERHLLAEAAVQRQNAAEARNQAAACARVRRETLRRWW